MQKFPCQISYIDQVWNMYWLLRFVNRKPTISNCSCNTNVKLVCVILKEQVHVFDCIAKSFLKNMKTLCKCIQYLNSILPKWWAINTLPNPQILAPLYQTMLINLDSKYVTQIRCWKIDVYIYQCKHDKRSLQPPEISDIGNNGMHNSLSRRRCFRLRL